MIKAFRALTLTIAALLIGFTFAGCAFTMTREDVPSSPKNDSVSSSGGSKTTQPDLPAVDSPLEVDRFREDYNLGTCKKLSGEVSVVLFYMDDFESSWSDEETAEFTQKEVEPGLAFLEQEAARYGVELKLTVEDTYSSVYYDDEVITSAQNTGLVSIDVLYQAARQTKYSSTEKMIQSFKARYGTEEVVCLTIFNKNGTAYAINPKRDQTPAVDEHCIVFAYDLYSDRNDPVGSQSAVVAHEMLHLFGGEDFYASASRKQLAQTYYSSDIMLSANYYIALNEIGEATAFYIGWSDDVPDVLYYDGW